MPELPDIEVYVEALSARLVGRRLSRIRLASPFLLRTVFPPLRDAEGRVVREVRRLAKRVVMALDGGPFLVLHLMVSGRLRYRTEPGAPIPKKIGLAAFDLEDATLLLTEASSKKRASLHVVATEAELAPFARGGLELEGASLEAFVAAMTRTPHTLRRALTDPTILSGIGGAYADEILHEARLSPLRKTTQLDAESWARLLEAARRVLATWVARLRAEAGGEFPENVTAFRPGMAVHGRYGQPCPRCGAPVQRIVYADNETNYCAPCQTDGKLLADRSLSRLLGDDWPRSLEELEEHRPAVQRAPDPARSTRPPRKRAGPKA